MIRYFIELAYNGSDYHGWQIQPNANTVQAVLNKAISTILREEIMVTGAGRTDTGVHAEYFTVHFDSENEITFDLTEKLNRFLPNDIVIFGINKVSNDLHSRFDAISRTYKYRFTLNRNPFFENLKTFIHYTPNIKQMNLACEILYKHIDFTSFSKVHTDVKTNNCNISFANWNRENENLTFTITADRFLRNMVRAIVGTMLDIGKGNLSLIDFESLILSKNRSNAGNSAPAHGLYLTDIVYPSEKFTPRNKNNRLHLFSD